MANKTVKKGTSNKIDFSDSINAIKKTAKTVNTQVKVVTDEVVADLKENSEQLKDMTISPVIEAYGKAYEKVTETVNMDNLAKAAKNANNYALNTTEEFIEVALANGEKWQGVAAKAVKGGLKLASKQQEIIFDTLDTVKGQLSQSAVRLRKLFSNN